MIFKSNYIAKTISQIKCVPFRTVRNGCRHRKVGNQPTFHKLKFLLIADKSKMHKEKEGAKEKIKRKRKRRRKVRLTYLKTTNQQLYRVPYFE